MKATDLTRYRTDPVAYATECLALKLTADQEAMLRSIAANRRTAVKASHAIGKTFTAAVACCWWYDCWDAHIAYVTAPNWSQALGLTFKQVKTFRRERGLPGRILETGRILDADKRKEGAHFIRALNAEAGEGFQGEHSAPILIIIEEGPGVPGYIWEAKKGLMTAPESRVFAVGNPTDEATDFGEACNSAAWETLTVSVLNHPNITAELAGQRPPFPEAVRLLWLKEMLETECEQSPAPDGETFEFWTLAHLEAALQGIPLPADAERCHYLPNASFQGRALGQFPTQATNKVVPRGWLENALVLAPEELPQLGCDVARFGDDRTAIADREGPCVFSVTEHRKLDNNAVTEALRQAAKVAAARHQDLDPKKVPIRIDTTGGLGTGPYDVLKAEGYAVEGVNSSERARNQEQYLNRRSELWFDTRERARLHRLDLSRLPEKTRSLAIRELSAPNYKVDGKGHKVVEDKATFKKRLGYSPDVADAINLSLTATRRRSLNWT